MGKLKLNYISKGDIQGKLFITSDLHFYHKNINKISDRRFTDWKEHDKVLVSNYNSIVGKDDTCIIVGDLCMNGFNKVKEVISKLNGRIILVKGNHDLSHERMVQAGCYLSVHNLLYDNTYIIHNPQKVGKNLFKNKGIVVVAGHTHYRNKIIDIGNKNCINVCVDAWEFKPILFDDLKQFIRDNIHYL